VRDGITLLAALQGRVTKALPFLAALVNLRLEVSATPLPRRTGLPADRYRFCIRPPLPARRALP